MASMHGHGGMGPASHSDGSVAFASAVPMQNYNSPHPGMGQQPPGGPQSCPPPPGQPQHQQQQQATTAKEFNAAMLCRLGQETVQEIVARSGELFQSLRTTQPPDGKINVGMDRKTKFLETLKTIKANFKRLRVIYEKIEESFPSNRDIPFEEDILNKTEDNLMVDSKKNTDSYKQQVEEYKEVMELVMIKNRHLKDAIDHLRTMIWDVNTMLAMRKE